MINEMTKRNRAILFIFFVFLFLLATPIIIFYFQGYRFDFENKKMVQTGALYFNASPASCQVYLDGDFKKKTSGFTGAILIENLIPREYQVEIRKTGYHSWQKNLQVRESQVSEAKEIILFPLDPDFTIVSEMPKIEMTATSSDKKKVIDVDDYEIRILLPEEDPLFPHRNIFITRFSKKIGDIFWLTDYYLIFSVGDKIKISEIDNRDKINIIDLAEFKEPTIFWDKNNKNLYVQSKGKIYLLENLLP